MKASDGKKKWCAWTVRWRVCTALLFACCALVDWPVVSLELLEYIFSLAIAKSIRCHDCFGSLDASCMQRNSRSVDTMFGTASLECGFSAGTSLPTGRTLMLTTTFETEAGMAYTHTAAADRWERKRTTERILRERSCFDSQHLYPLMVDLLSVYTEFPALLFHRFDNRGNLVIRLNTLHALVWPITVGFSPHCGGSISTLVVGVVVGLLPLFLFLLCLVCFLFDETQIWLGDLRVVCGFVVVCVCLFWCGFAALYMTTVSCT